MRPQPSCKETIKNVFKHQLQLTNNLGLFSLSSPEKFQYTTSRPRKVPSFGSGLNQKIMQHTIHSFRVAPVVLAACVLNVAGGETPDFADSPDLSELRFDPAEGFGMTVEGLPGAYGVEFSDDLESWDMFDEAIVAAEPVRLTDAQSLGLGSRFYRIGDVAVFPEYHVLLSFWGLEVEPGLSSFLMGFDWPDGVFLDKERQRIVVRNPAEAESRTAISSGGGEVTGDFGRASVRFEESASFSGGGFTVHLPEESDETGTAFAWDLPMKPLGGFAQETGPAGLLGGTALRQAEFGGGTGERVEFVQAFMARKSAEAGIGDLVGDWGIVRLEIEGDTEENLYTVLSAPVTITGDDGGTFFVQGTEIETEMVHFFDGSNPERRYFEPTEADFAFPLQVSPNGEVLLSVEGFGRQGHDSQDMAGFMSPAGDFFVLAEGWPAIHHARIDTVPEGAGDGFAAHQLFLGVRRDASPELAGREYRLEGQSFWVSRWDFEMLPSGPDGVAGSLAFDDAGEATLTLEDLIVFLPFHDGDQEGIVVSTEEPDEIPLTYTVAADGRLNFDMDAITDPGEQAFFTGFVQEGGRVLILGLGFAGEDGEGGDEGQISMWVATCVNCD